MDYLSRLINGKRDLPPLYLRRLVGPLRSFEASGAEFQACLRLLLGLGRDESILDIGCGCGLMALTLRDFLDQNGRYVGVDVHNPSIIWCRRNIQSRYPNFEFLHIDAIQLASDSKPTSAESFRFPFPDGAFDVVLLKSVFTHVRPEEIDTYLREIARLLSARGRCLATFFLLSEEPHELKKRRHDMILFEHGDSTFRYAYKNSPESAVAISEKFIISLLATHKLSLAQPVIYGRWSGLPEGLSFQDMLLIQRRTP